MGGLFPNAARQRPGASSAMQDAASDAGPGFEGMRGMICRPPSRERDQADGPAVILAANPVASICPPGMRSGMAPRIARAALADVAILATAPCCAMTGKDRTSGQRMIAEMQTSVDAAAPSKLKGFDDFEMCLGDVLRGERATKGKSLLDVQNEIRINAKYISAIEAVDVSAFEVQGFVAGYVRSYAGYLGIDPEWAFKTFCRESGFSVPTGRQAQIRPSARHVAREDRLGVLSAPPRAAHPGASRHFGYFAGRERSLPDFEPRALGSIVTLFALLVGIGYGGWTVLQEVQKVRLSPVEQVPQVTVDIDPVNSAFPLVRDVEEQGGISAATIPGRIAGLSRPEMADAPVIVARDGPIAAIDPDRFGALAPDSGRRGAFDVSTLEGRASVSGPDAAGDLSRADPAARFPPAPAVSPPGLAIEPVQPSVELLAARPCWVRVRGPDGTVVLEKILDAGERFDVPLTEEPARLRAGNASSLYFVVNGQIYGPAGNGPSVVSDVALSPEALVETYAAANVAADSELARLSPLAEAAGGE